MANVWPITATEKPSTRAGNATSTASGSYASGLA